MVNPPRPDPLTFSEPPPTPSPRVHKDGSGGDMCRFVLLVPPCCRENYNIINNMHSKFILLYIHPSYYLGQWWRISVDYLQVALEAVSTDLQSVLV